VHLFLIRHKDEWGETMSKPQAEARSQVPREFPFGTISGIKETVWGCVLDVVFNLDDGRSQGLGTGRPQIEEGYRADCHGQSDDSSWS
jgi:hypothetical protein